MVVKSAWTAGGCCPRVSDYFSDGGEERLAGGWVLTVGPLLLLLWW
jgi:hypothetical protein